jgi:hypothetical protein
MSVDLIVTCAGGPLLVGLIAAFWARYKAQRAGEPIPMKLRRGRWQPSGLIVNVDRAGRWFAYFGMACVLLGAIGAIYGALK